MKKKTLFILVFALLTVALALPTLAKMSEREQKARTQSELIDQLGMPQHELQRAKTYTGTDAWPRGEDARSWRAPLGAAVNAGIGVGEIIDNTYYDWQWGNNSGRYIAHSEKDGLVDVHFMYSEFSDLAGSVDTNVFASPRKSGYNVWNANDSIWPWGQEAGCLLQDGDSVFGMRGVMDIMPTGLAVFAATDNFLAKSQALGWTNEDYGFLVDNHFYYQEDRHSCYYDTGGFGSNTSQIAESYYSPGLLHQDSTWPNQYIYQPSIATQIVGNDTVTHVVAGEAIFAEWAPGLADQTYHVIKYFRKVGSDYTGTWEEAQVIDTTWYYNYVLAAAKNSDKVAVIWSNPTVDGVAQGQYFDFDMFYRESTNGGVDWGDTVNVTGYRRDTISATCWIICDAMYDTQNDLHILFPGTPTSENPYRDGYFWGDFSANLYHWSAAVPGIIAKAADANYGISVNTQVCGFGGFNSMYLGWATVSECDGNLYAVYNQMHSRIPELGVTLGAVDCSSDADRSTRANWEILLTISSSLQGLLWDAPRNLSNTFTPGCDSITGDSGACGNEYKPSLEKYALNESGLNLKWPPNALLDPDTLQYGIDSAYDGDWFLNLEYQDDQYPGAYYLGDNAVPTFNSMKWLRIPCVEPVEAPTIAASPRNVSWVTELAWVKNGETKNITVTVTNDGNQSLNVFTIGTDETSGSGWLSTSVGNLNVPAGLPNTATFDVVLDASGLTYGLGNSSWLDGEIWLKSDAGNNDSLSLTVHILAADSIEPTLWDTVATSAAWDGAKDGSSALGDNTALSVSNWGEFGAGGMGGDAEANLDFSKDGGECRTDDRGDLYAWGGSPYIIQHDGGEANMRISTSFNLDDQSAEFSFDPLVNAQGITSGVSTGGEYDSVYSGAFANRDTSLILERTFFAPRNNPDNPSFVVCKTVMYSGDGQQHDNVTIGSFTDWDIPSVQSPANVVGVSAPSSLAGQFVYAQGTDADTNEANLLCQDNANRYGAELFLDWYTNTEYNLDDCAANDTTWGSWGGSQTVSDNDGAGVPDVQQWYDSLSGKNGVFANDSSFDQSIWVTYLMDQTVGATDTLTFYTLFATLRNGSLSTFEGNLVDARSWYLNTIRGAVCATCCTGTTVGNVDCQGIIDIGDVTVMIQNLFITLNDPCCEDEADVDQSGLVDIGDLTIIISSLFITLNDMSPCP